jgi:2-iminobutanoate/2-iminopropanoate deaminase
MKEFRNPPSIHPPVAAYMHQVEVTDFTRQLILSGQIGRTVDGDVPSDPLEQLLIALDNVLRNLEAAGMSAQDIVKLTLYAVGELNAAKRGEIIRQKLNGHKPCMTLVFVAALASPLYKVEIEAWAISDR